MQHLQKTSRESATEVEKYRTQLAERYMQFEKARLQKAERAKAAELDMVQERLKQTHPVRKIKPKAKKIVNI